MRTERGRAVLRRLIRYSDKIFGLSRKVVLEVSDRRRLPRIPTRVFVKLGLVLFWARLGSLNALRQTGGSRFWKDWLRRKMPSDDSVGRVVAGIEALDLRKGLHQIYFRLKRNKALNGIGRLSVAVLDGHETHASYLRHCPGCLNRTVRTQAGDRVQYYHRNVTLMLLGEKVRMLLDVEAQRPGEDEVQVALRLLERVIAMYPSAFRVVLGDALYAKAPFVNYLWTHRKYVLIVLKQQDRNLYEDAVALFKLHEPTSARYRARNCLWWDVTDLTSWPQVETPMRVVRSTETYTVKRQASKECEHGTTEWMWVTNLPPVLAPTGLVVRLGHARWDIENYGFNELVNGWHADHVYKHDAGAIEAFYLLTFVAFNLFHAFLVLNVKPELRAAKTDKFWACVMAAEVYRTAQVRSP